MKILVEEYAFAILAMVVTFVMICIVILAKPKLEQTLMNTAEIEEEYVVETITYVNTKDLDNARKIILDNRIYQDASYSNYAAIADQYGERIHVIEQSENFISPITQKEYAITATPWHYNESLNYNVHLGLDYGAALGTNLYAPVNGLIIVAAEGCGTGFLGCDCKGGGAHSVFGGGNQIYMITSMKDPEGIDRVYVLAFMHLLDGTVTHKGIVEQGEVIAQTGTSGNSTGPHCHIEVYYLGEGTFKDIEEKYLRKDYTASFGCFWGEEGLKHICENSSDISIVTENEVSCRIDARKVLPQKEKDYIGGLWDEN